MTQPSTAPPPDPLAAERERGWRDGRLFDLERRLAEGGEREQRLAQLAWKPRFEAAEAGDDAALQALVLEARIGELQTYVKAVETSRPWRVIQWVRGLFGRAW